MKCKTSRLPKRVIENADAVKMRSGEREKMTEHVHEYHPSRQADRSYLLTCLLCPDTMTFGQASKRINATKRLSAEDARHILHLHAANENDDMWVLNEYADILEGKDG